MLRVRFSDVRQRGAHRERPRRAAGVERHDPTRLRPRRLSRRARRRLHCAPRQSRRRAPERAERSRATPAAPAGRCMPSTVICLVNTRNFEYCFQIRVQSYSKFLFDIDR